MDEIRFQISYPNWKTKALTFSYDDDRIEDRKLVEIFNKYDMKATFHVNTQNLKKNKYINKEEINTLYTGHEVANHGHTHSFF